MSNILERDRLSHVYLDAVNPALPPVPIVNMSGMTLLGSTVALLGIGAIYTSATYDVTTYKNVTGTCFSDVSGVIWFEFSPTVPPGVFWDGEDHITYVGGTGQAWARYPKATPWFHIRYVNGGVAQATFRLYIFGERE